MTVTMPVAAPDDANTQQSCKGYEGTLARSLIVEAGASALNNSIRSAVTWA